MACRELGITVRTRQRWLRNREPHMVREDGRKGAKRREPTNALSDDEKRDVLEIADSPEYASKPPAQIVADLADKGRWVASESVSVNRHVAFPVLKFRVLFHPSQD